MVFVGYSDLYDPDQPDRFYTSFTGKDGVDLSGVEIMATAYANLLSQTNAPAEQPTMTICAGRVGLRACLSGFWPIFCQRLQRVPAAFAFTALYAGAPSVALQRSRPLAAARNPGAGATAVGAVDRVDGPISARAAQGKADHSSHPLLPPGERGPRFEREAGRPYDAQPRCLRNLPRDRYVRLHRVGRVQVPARAGAFS